MQLIPKPLVVALGGQYFKNAHSVLFHPAPSEALDNLAKVMAQGLVRHHHLDSIHSLKKLNTLRFNYFHLPSSRQDVCISRQLVDLPVTLKFSCSSSVLRNKHMLASFQMIRQVLWNASGMSYGSRRASKLFVNRHDR